MLVIFMVLILNAKIDNMSIAIGKWVPTIARKIDAENPTAAMKINLKGIGIGDGLMSPTDSAIYGDELYQARRKSGTLSNCNNYVD